MCLVVHLSHEFSLFLDGVLQPCSGWIEFLQYGKFEILKFSSEQYIYSHQEVDRLDPWFFFEFQNCMLA